MANELTDARGVEIAAGDTVIYGFGVGRSVAMAEGVVLAADHEGRHPWPPEDGWPVSLTPKGRVRVRVVRRSYSSGEKPVVDIAPDRLVVLKEVDGPLQPGTPEPCFALPISPLPTQDEVATEKLTKTVARYERDIAVLEAGGSLEHWTEPHHTPEYLLTMFRKWLREEQAKLKRINDRDD